MASARMTSSRTALLLVLVPLAGACGEPASKREWTPADHGQPAAGDPDRTPDEPTAPETAEESMARAAAALWNASCASCHGRDGRGQGPARPPGAQMPDFGSTEWQTSRSAEQLAQVIREGRGMMPGFGKQLNQHGVEALVDHVRRFAPAPARPPAVQPDAVPPG
jgi:mono/diheme cytochrome c family protein